MWLKLLYLPIHRKSIKIINLRCLGFFVISSNFMTFNYILLLFFMTNSYLFWLLSYLLGDPQSYLKGLLSGVGPQ